MKTVKFYTLGCKVNQYETQAIREQFLRAGFRELEDGVQASVYVINTCTVTHRADRSSLYFIQRAYRENPDARIIVTGCLTQFDSDKIASISGDSLIVKNRDKHRIISLLNNTTDNRQLKTNNQSGITHFKDHSRAFLKIQDGCNYHCSYCKVCLVRGKSRSRTLRGIKSEVSTLVRNGYSEIVLSGICLGSYGRDLVPKLSLAKLIEELEEIKARFRIRLSSIELNDITDELLHKMRKSDPTRIALPIPIIHRDRPSYTFKRKGLKEGANPTRIGLPIPVKEGPNKLCRHLHIPVQSGDEQILKRMNRIYSPEQYIKLIQRLKKYIPEIAITTDVMVGFPGETDLNFNNTIELIKKIKPLRVHIFPYSKRLNTPAYNLGEFVSEDKIKLRMAILQKISQTLRLAFSQMFIGRVCEVLVERRVFDYSDLWEGYTDNYIRVRLKSKLNLKNQLIQVRLRRIYNDFVLADIACKNARVFRNSLIHSAISSFTKSPQYQHCLAPRASH